MTQHKNQTILFEGLEITIRPVALTVFIAVSAAYSSYKHGVQFALRYGGDPGTAWIWPLIVDGC